MNAEIIAIGSELLTPFQQDKNSLFLTDRLNQIGIEVAFKTIVGDNLQHLISVIKTALSRADVVILMGGLGPTEDDLTRPAAAAALERELHPDPGIITELYTRFAERRIEMPENNARQADVLEDAVVLPNSRGTAPGQWLECEWRGDKRIIILLPGPPHELKPMFDRQCMGRLRERAPAQFIATRELRIAMLPESQCDARIAPIYGRHPQVQTTILADAGEIQLHLRARAASREEAQKLVDALAGELEEELDQHIFSCQGESLEQIVGYFLEMRGATVAVAESCTGGLLSQRLTSVSGSSRYFVGGTVAYADDLKTSLVDVPPLLIAEHGAVSSRVAAALAEGIRKSCKTTFGIGITGVAGPTGGTPEKPAGLVFHALADGNNTEVVERRFPGDRERVRLWASQQALDMLRRKLAFGS